MYRKRFDVIRKNSYEAIILGYGRFEETSQKCLNSLLPQAIDEGIDVLAVDNGSPDNAAELLEAYARENPKVKTQINRSNLGFGGGMNQAVTASKADWIILVNSDIIFAQDSLKNLLNSIENAASNIGLIAPLTNNAGNGQCIFMPGNSAKEILKNAECITKFTNGITTLSYRADFCCVAIKTSIWRELDGLSPVFGKGYYEDFDFSLRAKKLGYQCAIAEDSFVYHEGSTSFKASKEQKDLIKNNKRIFLSKHPNAKLPHRRNGNLEALIQLKKLDAKIPSFSCRMALEKLDRPRSMTKKIWWLIKKYFYLTASNS
jgi:GT2 family glycosyltransferase